MNAAALSRVEHGIGCGVPKAARAPQPGQPRAHQDPSEAPNFDVLGWPYWILAIRECRGWGLKKVSMIAQGILGNHLRPVYLGQPSHAMLQHC